MQNNILICTILHDVSCNPIDQSTFTKHVKNTMVSHVNR